MSKGIAQKKIERKRRLVSRRRRIQYRLRERHWTHQAKPMFTARNIHYELADRTRGLASGGIVAITKPPPSKQDGAPDVVGMCAVCLCAAIWWS